FIQERNAPSPTPNGTSGKGGATLALSNTATILWCVLNKHSFTTRAWPAPPHKMTSSMVDQGPCVLRSTSESRRVHHALSHTRSKARGEQISDFARRHVTM